MAALGTAGWPGNGPVAALVAGGPPAYVALIANESVFVQSVQDVPLN